MFSTLQGIIGVLFAFSVAIFVHELGHFMFAKLFRVKVETFSLGFGKKLLSFRRGDTEYCISAIPFGGYVKMVGTVSKELEDIIEGKTDASAKEQDIAEDAARELSAPAPVSLADGIQDEINALRNKPYWQKILVFSAGCINNILTAVLIFFLLYWIGYNEPPAPDPLVGGLDDAVAELAPLQIEDRIVSVAGEDVESYNEFIIWFNQRETAADFPSPLTVDLVRAGTTMTVELPAQAPVTPPLPAGKIVKIGEREALDDLAGAKIAASLVNRPDSQVVPIVVETDAGTTTVETSPLAAAGPWWPALSILPVEPPRIELVLPNLPAEKAGLKNGDIILTINGEPVETSYQATRKLRSMPGETVEIGVERRTSRTDVTSTTVAMEVRPNPDNPEMGQIGVLFGGQRTELVKMSFTEAIPAAFSRTGSMIVRYWEALKTIFSSSFLTIRENLAGPVGISVQFFKTAQSGWFNFILTFAMFNIVLALTNLLPLPVLDGGHIMFATIEAIIRRPLPARLMIGIYNLFMFLIIALALMITFNDLIMNSWRIPFLGGK